MTEDWNELIHPTLEGKSCICGEPATGWHYLTYNVDVGIGTQSYVQQDPMCQACLEKYGEEDIIDV